MNKSHNFWLNLWYKKSKWVYLLLPLSCLFSAVSSLRKFFLIQFTQQSVAVPVIIVGNISLGGTGKTPLIIALVKFLQQQGQKPGVVSRGYGGKVAHYPLLLDDNTCAQESGDEPLLIFNATRCLVCVAPDRVAAAKMLVAQGCSIILSDDGLQHYRLARDLEIAVVDGLRLFGNNRLLPAGPLRESTSRLKTVDFVVVNNPPQLLALVGGVSYFSMQIKPSAWRKLQDQQIIPLAKLPFEKKLHAVAGIGNPQRFFNTLNELKIVYTPHEFDDHYGFTKEDFSFLGEESVVMTEKDAVKCQAFAKKEWYSLVVNAELDAGFWRSLQERLNSLLSKKL